MSRRLAVILVAILAACGTASGASPAAVVGTECGAERADLLDVDYVGGGDPEQRLDLHQPAGDGCEPVPLVVWVHGGAWRGGDKAQHIAPKAALWNDAGWAVASVNYRLTDVDEPMAERLLAPSHNQDAAAAVAWLVEHATALGVDPARIALAGHSAGGTIVSSVSIDPTYLAAHRLDPSVVRCVAPLDTEGFDVARAIAAGGEQAAMYVRAFGDDAARWLGLSPIAHLGEAPVPPIFLTLRGETARRAGVSEFAGAARAAGGTVTVVDLGGFTHGDVNTRVGTPADERLTPALQSFLEECLAG